MTIRRRSRLRRFAAAAPRLLARTALWLALCVPGPGAIAHADPRVWQDPATGLAIGGYDPLAYYTRETAAKGDEDHELRWGGAAWRFLNPGNRAAFERHPAVYAPRFAGYDPYALADGRAVRGLPSLWARRGERVYLFANPGNLRLWKESPDALIARAEANWPALATGLPSSPGG